MCAQTRGGSSQERRSKSLVCAIYTNAVWVLINAVLLQAMKAEPPLDLKCRDKFLVQSVAVTADKEFTNIAAIVRSYPSLFLERDTD